MQLLGHRNIKNTLVYTQLITFEDDEYVCKAASNVKEAAELVEAGYEYVCDMETVKLFWKRKVENSLAESSGSLFSDQDCYQHGYGHEGG